MRNYTTFRFVRIMHFLGIAALSVAGGVLGALLFGTPGGGADSVVIREARPIADEAPVIPASFATEESIDVSRAFQERFRQVAAATLPVVVEINTVNTVTQRVPTHPFFFFGRPDQNGGSRDRRFQQRGLGSGVIVGRDRGVVYVLTNHHFAGGADEIEIVLDDGRSYRGELVGTDELSDLALVSFETSEDIPIAVLGDADTLEIGDWVFAVGNPLGFQSTVTAGIVSAKERAVPTQSRLSGVTSFIQTDASINQGNSGGALVNLDGEVVGINTWIASRSGGSDGIGFAIPINMARRAIMDFIEHGEVEYSWLGVLTSDTTPDFAAEIGGEGEAGAFVQSVHVGSPAAGGGVRPGDLIVGIGGVEITSSSELVRAVASLAPREEAEVTVVRNGERMSLTIETSLRDGQGGAGSELLWPGLAVVPLDDGVREQLDVARRVEGVVVASVTGGSAAEGSGLRRGDVITAVNGSRVESLSQFYTSIAELEDDEVRFRVIRGGTTVILGFVYPRI
ncbi:MAG: Do family serine endopeptidase [Spirochaetales bacterium]|nr:Do family serine endopeptidase [Spirochaetales bacterium]